MRFVPVSEFAPVVRRLLADVDDPGTVRDISVLAGLHRDTLTDVILGERTQGVEFDVADKVLCTLSAQHLWYGELAHIYQAIDLEWYDRRDVKREHVCRKGHRTMSTIDRKGFTRCVVCIKENQRKKRQKQRERMAA